MAAANWVAAVKNTSRMKKVVDIRELVTHIVECGINDFAGTKYEDCWGFYHDALSLMCSKENMEWMEDREWLKYWVLPQFNLNTHFKYYKNHTMPGNHAKAMPWDSSCNKDHDDIVLRHVAATYNLDAKDPRKFSLKTPDSVSSAYLRVYNNPPVLRDGKYT